MGLAADQYLVHGEVRWLSCLVVFVFPERSVNLNHPHPLLELDQDLSLIAIVISRK